MQTFRPTSPPVHNSLWALLSILYASHDPPCERAHTTGNVSQFKGNSTVLRTCNDSAPNNNTAAKTMWLTLCNILQMLHSPLDPRQGAAKNEPQLSLVQRPPTKQQSFFRLGERKQGVWRISTVYSTEGSDCCCPSCFGEFRALSEMPFLPYFSPSSL